MRLDRLPLQKTCAPSSERILRYILRIYLMLSFSPIFRLTFVFIDTNGQEIVLLIAALRPAKQKLQLN
jgi:hypothetical protein